MAAHGRRSAAEVSIEAREGTALTVELMLRVPEPSEAARLAPPLETYPRETTPVYRRPWLWATVGGAVLGGVLATVFIARDRSEEDPTVGTLPPGIVVVEVGP